MGYARFFWSVPGISAARTILITGEGSHQMTAQEISQFDRYGLKPIIFVLNNNGYLIERLLAERPDYYYNDIAKWQYHRLPEGLGCEGWMIRKAATCGELDRVLAELSDINTGAYVELIMPEMSAPELMKAMHDNLKSMYSEG